MKTSTFSKRISAVFIALCMACLLAANAFAADTNSAVTADTTGVVQVKVVYIDDNGAAHNIQAGTGFLINDSTVITCEHVADVSDETLAMAAEAFGASPEKVKSGLSIQISVLRDVTVVATLKNASVEMDYAILNLNSQLYDRTYLPIRSSSEVQQTEGVYALGFPGETELFQDVNTYTSEDVTITSGQVNKLNTIGGVDYIQTSTKITSGNSGCPLVDANGNVVGICQGATGDGFDTNYYYAIAIDQLTTTLNALGIDYTKAGETAPVPTDAAATAAPTDAPETTAAPAPADASALQALVDDVKDTAVADYESDSADSFNTALQQAQTVLASTESTQEQIDAATASLNAAVTGLVPVSKLPMPLIIGLGVLLLLVIIGLIVFFVISRKKTSAYDLPPVPAGAEFTPTGAAGAAPAGGFGNVAPQTPSFSGTGVMGAGSQNTSVLNAGSEGTSVLNAGGNATSVLNSNTNYGTLTRVKGNEQIKLNNANFVIGKERARVNYCISDNTSISRCHITIVNRAGRAYVMDLKTTNGSFLNGSRLTANQEMELKDGDKLTLADEEFIYHI